MDPPRDRQRQRRRHAIRGRRRQRRRPAGHRGGQQAWRLLFRTTAEVTVGPDGGRGALAALRRRKVCSPMARSRHVLARQIGAGLFLDRRSGRGARAAPRAGAACAITKRGISCATACESATRCCITTPTPNPRRSSAGAVVVARSLSRPHRLGSPGRSLRSQGVARQPDLANGRHPLRGKVSSSARA